MNGDGNPLVSSEILWNLPWTLDVCTGCLREWPTGEVGFTVSFELWSLSVRVIWMHVHQRKRGSGLQRISKEQDRIRKNKK